MKFVFNFVLPVLLLFHDMSLICGNSDAVGENASLLKDTQLFWDDQGKF
jgi:hypothetical protein